MRTFVEHESIKTKSWFNKFWLIVPFDCDAIKRLWNNDKLLEISEISPTKIEKNRLIQSIDNVQSLIIKNNEETLTNAFIDKTFQIIFQVPPPVLFDWHEFLKEKFYKAFPNHIKNKEEIHFIYSLFAIEGIPRNRALAPRDIINFINNLGAIHRQWKDDIPLKMQAIYVLTNNIIHNPVEDIVKIARKGHIKSNFTEEYSIRWLSALYYNTRHENAVEILINNAFDIALQNFDIGEILQFSQQSQFFNICSKIIDKNIKLWATNSPQNIIFCSDLISNYSKKNLFISQIWNTLCYGTSQVRKWSNFNKEIGKKIAEIIKHIETKNKNTYIPDIIKNIVNTGREKVVNIRIWIKGALEIIKKVHYLELTGLITQYFVIPGEPDYYIAAMASLYDEEFSDEEFSNVPMNYFKSEKRPEQIIDHLSKGVFSIEYVHAINMMLKIDINWDWSELIYLLKDRIKSTNESLYGEQAGCIGALVTFAYKGNFSDVKNYLSPFNIIL